MTITDLATTIYLAGNLPNPVPVEPPGFAGINTILAWAKWGGLIAAIFALVALAVLFMVNSRRGEGGEHMKTFVTILLGVLLIGGASGIVGGIAGA
ncbi:hypothetical protein [Naasia lichenicola]|uniref:Conjugal transfer protein TrbC n=1 Tax=Naasia lichenicola TaxID=2565933 RepID=A0A4S4FGQ4_9MICO|nr:hypothetical protein [Naasia lichenicola]THG29291.1 hypothetical protein E6C64_11245 [Naasia lichenicola]